MIKQKIKTVLGNSLFWQSRKKIVYVFIDKNQIEDYPDYKERSEFYLGGSFQVIKYANNTELFRALLQYGPHRILFSTKKINRFILNLFFLNADYRNNPNDGWVWHHALSKLFPVTPSEITDSQTRLNHYVTTLPAFDKCLALGTGPSLAKARKLIGIDLYRIACNTIVKDHVLWTQLKPHFLVAGDGIYHFGHNQYAVSFRKDLKECLRLHPTLFLYPELFHPFVKREFGKEFSHLLVPVPTGTSEKINNQLFRHFELPQLGNILNLLLLPLATSLVKTIYLLGFDGRSPDDKLFWSNSNDHSYGEHIPDIREKHPRFFEFYIDKKDPFKYVKTHHGDALENNLQELENDGYTFIHLSPSYTPSFQKRFRTIFNLD
ncbi:MAG TPA: hypothetical protein VM012_13500 [Flavitalea sp.]|nr:hypothetical protein [Flavitalea sp.]